MANPTCSNTQFVDDATCYQKHILNARQQKALLIYAKALELAAIGGTNYNAVLATTLVDDAPCWLTEDQKIAGRVNLAFVNAAAAGATVPSDLDDKMAAIKCIMLVDPEKLDAMDLWLTCQLGRHKAYPQ